MNEIIFTYLNSFALRYEWLDVGLVFLADSLGVILIVGLGVLFFLANDRKEVFKKIVIILFSAGLAWFIARVIKDLYFSPRPFLILDNINLLFEHGENDSFPSGHASFFFALATAAYFYFRKFTILYTLYFAGALLIGISRIIAGVHWPMDILAGYVLGGLISYIIYLLYNRVISLGDRTSKW